MSFKNTKQRKAAMAKLTKTKLKQPKIERQIQSFPTIMRHSKQTILIPFTTDKYYFVGDRWSTTRYPKTNDGLKRALKHVSDNLKILKEQKLFSKNTSNQ